MTLETSTLLEQSEPVSKQHCFVGKIGALFFLAALIVFSLSPSSSVPKEPKEPPSEPEPPAWDSGLRRFEKLVGHSLPQDFLERARRAGRGGDSTLQTPAEALRQLRVARTVKVQRPSGIGPTDPYRITQCVGTIYDAANFLGWAALNIDALSIRGTCPDKEGDTTCSANTVGLLFNLMWVVNNAAQIGVWCVRNFTENSTASRSLICLVNMALFLASTLQITSDGLAVAVDCSYLHSSGLAEFFNVSTGPLPPRRIARRPSGKDGTVARLPRPPWGRRLEADIEARTRGNQLGVCSMIVMQLVNDLPYTGVDVWAAVTDCGNAMERGRSAEDFNEDCASDAFSIVSDLVNLVTDFLVVLIACPEEQPPKELPCTGDSTDITSNLFAIGAWALTIDHACNEENEGHDSVTFDIPPLR